MLYKAGKRHILLSALSIITVVGTFSLAGRVTVTPTGTSANSGGAATNPAPSQGAKVASLSGVKLGGDTGIFSKVAVNTTLDNQSSLVSYSGGDNGIKGMSDTWNGVLGMASTTGTGVAGCSSSGMGVYGTSSSGSGVHGQNTNSGNYGILGTSTTGVSGTGTGSNTGVNGTSINGYGVNGQSTSREGVFGINGDSGNFGVLGHPFYSIYGKSTSGKAVCGWSTSGYGVFGECYGGYAGYFAGPVYVSGLLTKAGGGFKIDHPQYPENKYLSHSFVESPDMMNVYNGNILLDEKGEAVVDMPSYFESLNRDFRYQLTCIGEPAVLYIAEEISSNHFKIAGGKSAMKVSWQVTGIRQDAFANAHPIVVEQEKPANEKGLYLNPVEWGQPKEKGTYQLTKP